MNEIIVSVLSSVTASTAAAAALVFLAKSWISVRLENSIRSEYDSKLASLKAELKAQYDAELAKLNASLRLEVFRSETQVADLHSRRAETIAETYALLRDFNMNAKAYIDIIGDSSAEARHERRCVAADSLKNFKDYYHPRELFLPEPTSEKINALLRQHLDVIYSFRRHVEHGQDIAEADEAWSAAYKTMESDIDPVFRELRNDFRHLLGEPKSAA